MIICLTGGIGSGKSTVASIFESLGALVFNSDKVAKDLYFDEEIKSQVITLLGPEAYLPDNSLNKSYISAAIFSDKNLLKKLNAIIHPLVIEKFDALVKQHPQKLIVKESALLFEAKLEKNCDVILVIAAEDKLRVERVMRRDSLSEEEVLYKLKNQWPQQEKIEKADYVIYNNEQDLMLPQVIDLYQRLLKKQLG